MSVISESYNRAHNILGLVARYLTECFFCNMWKGK